MATKEIPMAGYGTELLSRVEVAGGPAPLRDGVLVRLGDFEGRLPRPAERVAGKTPVSTLSRGTRLGRCRSL